MRKKTLIIVIAVVVFSALAALFIIHTVSNKTAMSVEDFVSQASDKGFEVLVASEVGSPEDIAAYAAIIDDSVICTSDQCRLEFYAFTSTEYAHMFFAEQKNAISTNPNNSPAKEASVSLGSYANYSITTNEYYYYLAVIDSTVLFVGSTVDNCSGAKQVIKDLNY